MSSSCVPHTAPPRKPPNGVPDLVEAVGFLQHAAQGPPLWQLQRLADVNILAVGAVESKQVADLCAIREAETIAQRWGAFEITIASAQQLDIGAEILGS